MRKLDHVNLEKSFNDLKTRLIEIEEEKKERLEGKEDTAIVYAAAYGQLSGAVESFLFFNTDAPGNFMREETANDIPEHLFTQK